MVLGGQTRKCVTQAPLDSTGAIFPGVIHPPPSKKKKKHRITEFEHHDAKYPLQFTVIM